MSGMISLTKENVIGMVRIAYYTCYRFVAIDRHNIAEILMKVALITITLTPLQLIIVQNEEKTLDNGHSLHVQIS